MARFVCVSALLVLAFVAVVNSQCIECKDCRNNNYCLSQCKQSCGVDINKCAGYGVQAGKESAQLACDLTLKYCQAPTPQPKGAKSGSNMVTLQQCGNAAYGVCQSDATSSKSPCSYAFNGAGKCTKDQFWNFYNGVINEQCNKKASVFDIQPRASGH